MALTPWSVRPGRMLWLAGPLLLVLCPARGQSLAMPEDFTTLAPLRDNKAVCAQVKFEAKESCREFAEIGLPETDCQPWGQMAENTCLSTFGNCTAVTEEVLVLCRLQLQDLILNNEFRLAYCMDSMLQLREYRCPPISYAPLYKDNCYTPDPTQPFYRGYTEEARECMTDCGMYGGCSCRKLRGTIRDDYCEGTVAIESKPLPGYWDPFAKALVSPGNYSCDTLDQPPQKCRHNIAEGVNCSRYKYCEPDMCILKDVSCPNRTQCEEPGRCDPKDGYCHFRNKKDGLPCDDEIYYTFGDRCVAGLCEGTIDYCVKYNVSCVPMSVCLKSGTCNSVSGRCTYEKLQDGSLCDDGREYTVEDRCQKGLCVGKVVNLCVERGVVCEVPNSCFDVGTCDPLTGMCSDPTMANDNRRCDDGDPVTANETCIDGLCIGVPVGSQFEFLTLAGFGECSDRDGRRMGRYTGDVLEGEEGCLKTCLDDVQCAAYGYSYPLCSIYGTARTRAPPGTSRPWSFELGTDPPAVAVETVKPPALGQKQTVCRKKGFVADVEEADAQHEIRAEDYFNFWVVFYLSLVMTLLFFFWPVAQMVLAFCFPNRYAVHEDIVEEVEIKKPRRDRKSSKKKRRRSHTSDEDSDEAERDDGAGGFALRASTTAVSSEDGRAQTYALPSEGSTVGVLQGAVLDNSGGGDSPTSPPSPPAAEPWEMPLPPAEQQQEEQPR